MWLYVSSPLGTCLAVDLWEFLFILDEARSLASASRLEIDEQL